MKEGVFPDRLPLCAECNAMGIREHKAELINLRKSANHFETSIGVARAQYADDVSAPEDLPSYLVCTF